MYNKSNVHVLWEMGLMVIDVVRAGIWSTLCHKSIKMHLLSSQCRCRPRIVSIVVNVCRGPIVVPIVQTSPIPNRPNVLLSPWHGPMHPTSQSHRPTSMQSIWWPQSVQLPPHDDWSTVCMFKWLFRSGSFIEFDEYCTLNVLFLIDELAARLLLAADSKSSVWSARARRLNESTVSSKSTSALMFVALRFERKRFNDERTCRHKKHQRRLVFSAKLFGFVIYHFTLSSNSSMAAPIELFGTRAPRTSKNESSVMTRSARRLAFSIDSSAIGSAKIDGRDGEIMRSADCDGLYDNNIHENGDGINFRILLLAWLATDALTFRSISDPNCPEPICSSFRQHCNYNRTPGCDVVLLIQHETWCLIESSRRTKTNQISICCIGASHPTCARGVLVNAIVVWPCNMYIPLHTKRSCLFLWSNAATAAAECVNI